MRSMRAHMNLPTKFRALSQTDVKNLINSMSAKSCENDSIPSDLMKQIQNSLLPVLTKIINLSLEKGIFVQSWKTAIVRPLLKKAGLDLISKNYRPVSNLIFLSKILEKAALLQIVHHWESNDLLPDYQSAYRSNRSCETALVRMVNDILWGMERQQISALVAIDLSAAFDTVSHKLLLGILRNRFGIEDTVLDWCDSYLRPRSFRVVVNGEFSRERDLPFGVPQGSLLGPFYYLAYASPMEDVVSDDVDIYGFADDHGLRKTYAPSPESERIALSELGKCLANIKNWMDMARLQMNCAKTEFIKFGSIIQLNKCSLNDISVCDTNVECTQVIKYLGSCFDSGLTFKKHISVKCKSAMLNLFRIRMIANILDRDTLITLILMLVISHLDYANCILTGLPKCELAKFQRIQNMAAKLVLGKRKFDSATDCLKALHWLPIVYRIKFKNMCLVFKCLNNEAPDYLKDLLQLTSNSKYSLRSNNKVLQLKETRTKRKTFADRSFSVSAPREWNLLPDNVKLSNSIEEFKNRLKTYYFKLAFNC